MCRGRRRGWWPHRRGVGWREVSDTLRQLGRRVCCGRQVKRAAGDCGEDDRIGGVGILGP